MIQTDLTERIRRARDGDRQAQEELISDIQNRVYYHCKKMMKHESDAQDAAQDVLVTVLTSLDKLRDPAAFYGWVNGITANRCRHLLSQGVREWQLPEDEDGGSALDSLEDLDQQTVPDAVLDDKETQRMMMEIIDTLSPEQRMSVLLYYYDEMSVKEIAQAMGTSEGTVKSRLNYARKSIKAGVESLEKRGTKLYSVAPLALLVFFLRREAEQSGLSAAEGAQLTAAALSEAEAAGAGAAGVAGLSGAAGVAGGAAAKAGLGLGTKIAAGIAAAALAGGLIAGGVALLKEPEEPPEPTPEPTVEAEPAPTPAPATAPAIATVPVETPEPELEGPSEEDLMALLDSVVYYGEREACKLTPEQAAAFAAVIRQETADLEARARESAYYGSGAETGYQAALFDVGDGTTALFFGGGLSYDWENQTIDRGRDSIGINGIWEYRDGRAVPYPLEGLDVNGYLGRTLVLREGYLVISGGDETGSVYSSLMYPLTGSALPEEPLTFTTVEHVPLQPDTETYYIDGVPVTEAEYDAWGDQWHDQEVLCRYSWRSGIGGQFSGLGEASAMADALERYAAGTGPSPVE